MLGVNYFQERANFLIPYIAMHLGGMVLVALNFLIEFYQCFFDTGGSFLNVFTLLGFLGEFVRLIFEGIIKLTKYLVIFVHFQLQSVTHFWSFLVTTR